MKRPAGRPAGFVWPFRPEAQPKSWIKAQELSAEQKRCAERKMSKSLVSKQAWEEAEPKLTAASLSFNTKSQRNFDDLLYTPRNLTSSFIPVAQVSIEGSVKDNAVQNSPTEPLVVNDEAIFDAAFGPARAFDAPYQVPDTPTLRDNSTRKAQSNTNKKSLFVPLFLLSLLVMGHLTFDFWAAPLFQTSTKIHGGQTVTADIQSDASQSTVSPSSYMTTSHGVIPTLDWFESFSRNTSAELYKTQQMFHDMATRSQREMAAALGENKRLREEVSEFKSEVAEVRDAFTNLTAFIHAQLSNTSAELSGTQQMFQDEFARSRRVTAVELGETKKLRGEVSDFKFEVADVSSAVTNLTTVIHTRLSNTSTELSNTKQFFHEEITRRQKVRAMELEDSRRLRADVSGFKDEVAEVRNAFTNLTTSIHTQLSNTSAELAKGQHVLNQEILRSRQMIATEQEANKKLREDVSNSKTEIIGVHDTLVHLPKVLSQILISNLDHHTIQLYSQESLINPLAKLVNDAVKTAVKNNEKSLLGEADNQAMSSSKTRSNPHDSASPVNTAVRGSSQRWRPWKVNPDSIKEMSKQGKVLLNTCLQTLAKSFRTAASSAHNKTLLKTSTFTSHATATFASMRNKICSVRFIHPAARTSSVSPAANNGNVQSSRYSDTGIADDREDEVIYRPPFCYLNESASFNTSKRNLNNPEAIAMNEQIKLPADAIGGSTCCDSIACTKEGVLSAKTKATAMGHSNRHVVKVVSSTTTNKDTSQSLRNLLPGQDSASKSLENSRITSNILKAVTSAIHHTRAIFGNNRK